MDPQTKMLKELDFRAFATGRAPFRGLSSDHMDAIVETLTFGTEKAGETLLDIGDDVPGLYIITAGRMALQSPEGDDLLTMYAGDIFGHRAILRKSGAVLRVKVEEDAQFAIIPKDLFLKIFAEDRIFATFFERRVSTPDKDAARSGGSFSLVSNRIGDLMTRDPASLDETQSARNAAALMREKRISCVLVTDIDGKLSGILTNSDLVSEILVAERSPDTPLSEIMTRNPVAMQPEAPVMDAIMAMTGKRMGHLPVVDTAGKPIGIVTQTDLVRRNSNSLIHMVNDIARLDTAEGLAEIVARKPKMLVELVGAGIEGYQVGRMMTSVSDAVTRRLIELALAKFGPAPIGWAWLACGSQGRQEQTGVSDQDNCLFLSDDYVEAEHGAYFEQMAKFVSDGLDTCGYFYCPGDMMATNPQWRQPVRVWRSYFTKWIERPDPMAQMLASVMFDLRVIAGDASLFNALNKATLEKASKDSIFRAHMTANSLKHTPPLGLFGRLTLSSDKDHKNSIDMKHSGVVPITDLGRLYALTGRIEQVNTYDRLVAARDMEGVLSKSGGNDLIDAYELIVDLRLNHQAEQIRAGQKPDNFMSPDTLSALERNHLKDAFFVVKTLQSAAGIAKG